MMTSGHSQNRDGQFIAAIAMSGVLVLIAAVIHRHFFHDDALISLRYARNFAEHGQLAWNLGEYVEGYTNSLQVVLAAGLIKIGVPPMLAVQLMNAVFVALLILVTARAVRLAAPDLWSGRAGWALAVSVFASPVIAIWMLGGLETVMIATFLAVGLLCLLTIVRSGPAPGPLAGAAVAFSLAVLTRMDSAVFIAFSGLAVLLVVPGSFRRRLGAALIVAAIPAAVSLAHMAWRYSYYGELLPLTFHTKTGVPADIRLGYILPYLRLSLTWIPLIALGAIAVLLLAVRRNLSGAALILGLPFTAQLAYVIWSGGDFMPAARVLLPLIVPAALLVAVYAETLPLRQGRLVAGAALILSLLPMAKPPLHMDSAAWVGTLIGRHIDSTWPADAVVALNTAGATPFHATSKTYIDMLGLNDPVIARRESFPMRAHMQFLPGHAKGDGAYVLSRKPDYIIAGHTEGTPAEIGVFLSDLELDESAEFHACYALREETIPYDDAYAAIGPSRPNPLKFTYYQRICE